MAAVTRSWGCTPKPRRSRGPWWTNESGAELVEFALVFPLFLLVMLGIIDFGLLFQRYQVVTNAAREGARIAVLPGYAPDDVAARVNQYLEAAGLDPVEPSIGNETVEVGDSGHCIKVHQVTVTYPHGFSFVGGIAGFFGDALAATEMQVTSEMRSELAATLGC